MEITALTQSESNEFAGQLALPFDQSQLGNFIVSLLGKPQTLTRRFNGSYEIEIDTLSTLYQLIEQRIKQQNEATLVQFRTVISYSDGATVELNGFEHLIHYNESMHLIPVALDVTWQYLIKFRDKEVPERQEISIIFNASGGSEIPLIDVNYETRGRENQIYLIVKHTARTWGVDMEALLAKHLESLIKHSSKIKSIYSFDDEDIYRVANVVFLIVAIAVSIKMIDISQTGYIIYMLCGAIIFGQIFRLILDKIVPQRFNSFIFVN